MASEKGKLRLSVKGNGKFALKIGRKSRELTYEETFAYGHAFLKAKKLAPAVGIFRTLVHARGGDRRAMIMLALCEATGHRFDVCQKVLQRVFRGRDESLAERLHSAFVYHKLGMSSEATKELADLVTANAELPAVCLILGDLFETMGHSGKAASCWQMAIKRDDRGGAVAVTARGELARLKNKQQSALEHDH